MTNSIILDEKFRAQFNKSPEKISKEAGISLNQVMIKKLKRSTITERLRFMTPERELGPSGVLVAGAILVLAAAVGPKNTN